MSQKKPTKQTAKSQKKPESQDSEYQIVESSDTTPTSKVTPNERYNENPFMDRMLITTRDKRLTVARGSHIIDLGTGEVEGVTEIAQVVQVDREEFVKLFTKDLAVWFDLSRAGQKTLALVIQAIGKKSINKDTLILDHEETMPISRAGFFRGLHELIEKQVIAKARLKGLYFINPTLIFNGDRARFVKEYRVRKQTPPDVRAREELEAHGQQRLPIIGN